MTRSSVPDFTLHGRAFECWSDEGQYIWISGNLRVGRIPGGPACWATANGQRLTGFYPNLKQAMVAAVMAAGRRKAA